MRKTLLSLTILLLAYSCAALADDRAPLGTFEVVIAEIDVVDIAAQERGLIVEFPARTGAAIEADELLGRIDDAPARIERDLAESELQVAVHKWKNDLAVQLAGKAIEVAEAELARAENANREIENTVSASEVSKLRFVRDSAVLDKQQAERNRREAELTVELKRHQLALAQLALERRVIRSSVRGTVVEVLLNKGEWVEPGDTVVRIMNTDRVHAEALVNLKDVPEDITGNPVRVRLTLPNQQTHTFNGSVIFVDPTVNVVSGEFRILAEIENPRRLLRPGHRASMTILPAVPQAAETSTESSL
jgi:multidrug resistance efflux pump